MDKQLNAFRRLLEIMDELRVKCPWDQKQTLQSLRLLSVEEVYELSDAIIANKPGEIKKELGDILLHIVFYAKIASETGLFDIADVIDELCKKLIFRHPHVFGEVLAENEEVVKTNWEALKLKEGNKSVLGGVPTSLPAMLKAYRIQDKARSAGFDWEKREDVWVKVREELTELEAEMADTPTERMEEEFGDYFFALINAARLYKIDPEAALEKCNLKFIRRFNWMEKEVNASGRSLSQMTLREMDEIWDECKRLEKSGQQSEPQQSEPQ